MYDYVVVLVVENSPDGAPKSARQVEEEAVRTFEELVGDGPQGRYDFYRPALFDEVADDGALEDLPVRREVFESASGLVAEVYSAWDLREKVFFEAAVTPEGRMHEFDPFEPMDWEVLGEYADCLAVLFYAHF